MTTCPVGGGKGELTYVATTSSVNLLKLIPIEFQVLRTRPVDTRMVSVPLMVLPVAGCMPRLVPGGVNHEKSVLIVLDVVIRRIGYFPPPLANRGTHGGERRSSTLEVWGTPGILVEAL